MEEIQRRTAAASHLGIIRRSPGNHEEVHSRGRPCYRVLWEDLSCEGFDGIES